MPPKRPSCSRRSVNAVVMGGAGTRPGVRRLHVVYRNAERLARARELGTALDAFEADVRQHVALARRPINGRHR